ncbi:hypothetical protein NLJ89_g5930 [Agrocybe chaxingu]|uniref:Protein kinase domain-containing protein n=1 Tax=Agrocybe chaxingu TaxID=84603 RepID=A0A9W8MWX3_9AGAR|nr:hypothetical protein NLJ89_g5930 [Agrocybe chaxingu]
MGLVGSWPDTVTAHEELWVRLQPLLLRRGYKLRPRYDPDWKPSWKGPLKFNQEAGDYEDYFPMRHRRTIDAVRLVDNTKVVLKQVSTSSQEIPIARYLNSERVRSDPRNKAVPLFDVILLPWTDETALLVMPMLVQYDTLSFRFMSEICEALEQFFLGLVFMHEHRIAHRDACWGNLVMDFSRVMPGGYHFASRTTEDGKRKELRWVPRKSVAPVKYYYIDFGLSHKFPENTVSSRLAGLVGQDRTVPEAASDTPYDAFKYDIYQLGNVLAQLIAEYEDLSAFKPLSDLMKRRDPEERPSASEAYETLVDLILRLNDGQLDQRVWHKKCPPDLRYRIEHCNENPFEYYPSSDSSLPWI